MTVIEKVRALNLPNDQYVVIGSGLLDAWGLRVASDVDLVVSRQQFDALAAQEQYMHGVKNSDRYLVWNEYEIFDNWGEDASFETLLQDSILVDGVRFVSPQYLIAWKRGRGLEKDLRDVALLERKLINE